MDLALTAAERDFREQVRSWLAEHVPKQARPLDLAERREYDLAWQRTQYDGGWAGIAWPTEYGGRGLDLLEQMIWYEEYARAEAPPLGTCFVGLAHAGPTLISRATAAQKAAYLPPILRGEHIWCQGFSEPGAGSDLASLSTRAVVDGDDLVVNGTKIWTSYASVADYQELLVRTDPQAPKHRGISWVVCDMRSPGITIRPIPTLNGELDFCEVFYDDVRIPLANVVGEINAGWSVAMSTLSFERGTAFMAEQIELARQVEDLLDAARVLPGPDGARPAISDDGIARELARVRAEVASLRAMTYLGISRIARSGAPGPEGSMLRYHYSTVWQRVYRLAMDVVGDGAVLGGRDGDGRWTHAYLNSLRSTIAAGTKDIQRTIIAERVLGLPRAS
ncbi:acyl-CoA dehydrogenase family protein [Cryptosporangium aurantiacum]|uniref:Acyl-CoA dehydrogenase n=1 Tax=Cryptosporangium aurantiacum TaxID=134849 RepID=A0A1M7R4Q0_9ACTN|nr:acyl-CoA dehydrogenase family protein [Cryptosporangium aurantiacum]SHN40132.1 Acyl-CoA dehydrogenase [Cryptosporangium aurantiacum]